MRPVSRFRRLAALLALLLIAVALWTAVRFQQKRNRPQQELAALAEKVENQAAALDSRESQIAGSFFAKELLAQRAGGLFESLWNSINAASNKLEAARGFSTGELIPAAYATPELLPHGIRLFPPQRPASSWAETDWKAFVDRQIAAGWQLDQVEFRQNEFDPEFENHPAKSRFYFSAHLRNTVNQERAVFEGDLFVQWKPWPQDDQQLPIVERIDASSLTLKIRRGPVPFEEILFEEIAPPQGSYFIDPLIIDDLDGDGLPEIILAAKNRVYRRNASGAYAAEPLCRVDPGLIFTGIIADFNGDGLNDFLCAKFEGLFLYAGSVSGRFDAPPEQVWTAQPHLKYAQVLAGGDIDGDGDLDVWVGQYKIPYERGQMPTPFYDAKDSNPSYLLVNDGRGRFTDATAASGLASEASRRIYSASFVDLDGDGDLDFVGVSDFRGLDAFENVGRGKFREATAKWFSATSGFGMSHSLGDLNADGQLDLLMIGMNSPTADRLEHLGFSRPGANDRAQRRAMTFGNRLYLQRQNHYLQTPLNDTIARTGWSWGAAIGDFDNDGFPDVYISNGHETRESVEEYEPEFWLHDIYVADSRDNPAANLYFLAKFGRTRGVGHSYGGNERNRFFFNVAGQRLVEAAYLLGVALPEDSRNVAAEDLDGDGRVDLLVTTFEVWPKVRQTLHVYRNALQDTGNWIGFHLNNGPAGRSPIGVTAVLSSGRHSEAQTLVTGDGFRAQRSTTFHFGLGSLTNVDRVIFRWPNGRTNEIRSPAIGRYHSL